MNLTQNVQMKLAMITQPVKFCDSGFNHLCVGMGYVLKIAFRGAHPFGRGWEQP